jgi:hypothetical protein
MSGEMNVPYLVELVSGDLPAGYIARDNPTLYRRESSIGTGVVFIPSDAIEDNADDAQVTIHSRVCPVDYQGADLFNDCHGTAPPFQQVFLTGGPTVRSVQTNDEGNATFDRLTPGDWTIWTFLREGDTLRDAFCSDVDTPGVRSDQYEINPEFTMSATMRLDMHFHAGDSLICDVYVTPQDVLRDDVLLTVRFRSCDDLSSPTQIYGECFASGLSGLVLVCEVGADVTRHGIRIHNERKRFSVTTVRLPTTCGTPCDDGRTARTVASKPSESRAAHSRQCLLTPTLHQPICTTVDVHGGSEL